MTHEQILASLHDFWFAGGAEYPSEELFKRWFIASSQFDEHLREKFQPLAKEVAAGECREIFARDVRAAAATIVALDQLPRNIYRGKPEAFAADELAQQCAQSLLDSRRNQLWPAELIFTLMPLMHAENLELQKRSVREFENLAELSPEANRKRSNESAEFARQHCLIISKFGRFPHRNAILGRESTDAELAWLSQEKVDFGQKQV